MDRRIAKKSAYMAVIKNVKYVCEGENELEKLGWGMLGALFFFPILYFVVKSAVENGTLNAMIKYKEYESRKDKV